MDICIIKSQNQMKKNLLIIAFLSLVLHNSQAQEENFKLTVEISGLKNNTGKVLVALFDSEETFLKKNKELKGISVLIENNKATAVFKGVQKGEYALSLFHDKNNNNKLDTNFVGIPKEPYAFSNNATGFMGPPKFEESKVLVDSNKTIKIKIN
jgi:uncharacterized protein (DUF2141 family)